MKIAIKVPQLPESVSEATLLNWHKKQGDFVKREENLIDLETDKVVLELPVADDGVLVETIGKAGDIVKSGQLIAYLDTSIKQKPTGNESSSSEQDSLVVDTVTPTKQHSSNSSAVKDNVLIMPAATKIATENNIDLNNVSGSGRGSRILKEDVSCLKTIPSDKCISRR